jgi:NADH-quinone oxidoreductase subunit M
VVTAVYILRAAGSSVMGPITQKSFLRLTDAQWNEKLAAIVLLSGIVIIGIAPFLLTDLLSSSTDVLLEKIINTF